MDVEIPCVCPPKADGTARHLIDTVTLRERLDFHAALVVRNAIVLSRVAGDDLPSTMAALTEQYLLNGIEAWSLVDAKNRPAEVTKDAIRAFMNEHQDAAMTVADEADALYVQAVMADLAQRASSSSPPTPTDASTSAPTALPKRRRKPSSPSLTTTSQTDATAPTTLSAAGGSSY